MLDPAGFLKSLFADRSLKLQFSAVVNEIQVKNVCVVNQIIKNIGKYNHLFIKRLIEKQYKSNSLRTFHKIISETAKEVC